MKLRDRDPAPDPQAERELRALDEALAGRAVEAEMSDLASLAAKLRDLRPAPDQAAAARLDEAAAALGDGTASGRPLAGTWSRFAAAPLRRRLMPVAAAGLAAIVAATVIVSGTGKDSGSNPSGPPITALSGQGAAPSRPGTFWSAAEALALRTTTRPRRAGSTSAPTVRGGAGWRSSRPYA